MDLLYTVLRSLFMFLFMMFMIRVLGKREVGELSNFDLVVILVVANVSSMGIENKELFVSATICLISFIILQKAFSLLLLNKAKLRKIIDGEPSIIVINGKLNYDVMKKEKYTVDDLIIQMRAKEIMDIKDLKLAILETNGELSTFTKDSESSIILPVVLSGRIIEDNLVYLNLSKDKLYTMLKTKKVELNDIIYASSDGKDIFIPKLY